MSRRPASVMYFHVFRVSSHRSFGGPLACFCLSLSVTFLAILNDFRNVVVDGVEKAPTTPAPVSAAFTEPLDSPYSDDKEVLGVINCCRFVRFLK